MGFHQLQVIIDRDTLYDENFLVFPVRWIYVEFQKGDTPATTEDINFSVELSLSPIELM
jgi:hypothetical protein